jgi:hypothetical protein
MTIEHDVIATAPAVAAAPEQHSYVDWAAIIGGIVLASAISLLLLTFGSAIGLGFTSFHAGEGVSPIWLGVAAATWLLWVEVSSFMAGGYLTGRMRRRFHDATEHESDVRDGAHGLLVWAGALIVGAIIAVSGIGALANTAGAALSTATTAAAGAAGNAKGGDPQAYFVDTLFRVPAGTTAPAATPGSADPRAEATRILASAAASGNMPDADRTYLADLVSRNTGLSEDQAKGRVDDVLKAVDTAKQKLADAAEQARKLTVLAAFLTAASLLISAAGAYWAAMTGGRHRDDHVEFTRVFGRF